MTRRDCPISYLDLSTFERELFDKFAIAYAHSHWSGDDCYLEALWTIEARRWRLRGEEMPGRWIEDAPAKAQEVVAHG